MCGIAGVLELARTAATAEPAAAMARVLGHRGPDGAGLWSEGPVALGHRRLAIIDLSPGGAQPMASADGKLHIVYNGELYNYVELREELRGLGHRFTSGSDTEVILRAYEQWDTDCLRRFNGMFAFALWDARRGRLFCARDRFGIKPFCYTLANARLLFASEIKALLATGLVETSPDDAAIHRFLISGLHPSDGGTFFRGIRQLPPAHALVVEHGRVEERRWWRLPQWEGSAPLTDGRATARFRELFEDAVRLRLRSDVPVGSCLSGGLDSSAIVCTVAALPAGGAGRHSFSAVYDDPALSERAHLDAVVERTGVASHTVSPEWDEFVDALPRLVWQQEAPFISTSIFAQWKVMELARRTGVTVLLDGQGADELLAGYPAYWHDHLAGLARAGRATTLLTEARRVAAGRGEPVARVLARAALRGSPSPWRAPGLLHPDFVTAHPLPAPEPDAAGHGADRLTSRLAFDLTAGNLPGLLHYEDRNSMAFSVEARLPFLDYRLVEFACALGPDLKLRDGLTKWVLREAMRGVLPEPVRARHDKLGFVTPETRWLTGPGRPWIEAIIASPAFRSRPYFDGRAFDGLRVAPDAAEVRSSTLWRCISVELWLRTFFGEAEDCDGGRLSDGRPAFVPHPACLIPS